MTFLLMILMATSLVGILVCHAITQNKTNLKKICDVGSQATCSTVLKSRYSTFLGMPLESLGLFYYSFTLIYAVMVLFYVLLNFLNVPSLDGVIFLLLGITGAGFAMSCHLVFIQAFYIKSWCKWCLRSALVSTILFITTIILAFVENINILGILEMHADLLVTIHIIAFALCLVFGTLADLIVIRFVRSFTASAVVEKMFRIASQITLVGLYIVVLTLIGLFMPYVFDIDNAPALTAQVVATIIIILNTAFLNLYVSPILYDMVNQKTVCVETACVLRKISFGLIAVSLASWYTAFALAIMYNIPYSFWSIMLGYGGILVGAIIISQAVEMYTMHAKK